jgi:hypothetical protein
MSPQFASVRYDDAAAFLTSVLQREQGKERKACNVFAGSERAEDGALVTNHAFDNLSAR